MVTRTSGVFMARSAAMAARTAPSASGTPGSRSSGKRSPGSFSDPPYSVNVADRPRLPLGAASHTVSGSNQIYSDPRCFRAALAIGLEPMAPQWLDRSASSSYDSSEVWICSCTPTNILESRRESLDICATEPSRCTPNAPKPLESNRKPAPKTPYLPPCLTAGRVISPCETGQSPSLSVG